MENLIQIISTVGYFGYLILFVVIFLEAFPPTFFLPGDSLLFITGFLASAGHFNVVLLILTFFTASTLGYIFSYAMGKKVRDFILNSNDRYWFKIKHLHYTEEFYKKYGAKTLIISRFVPVVRSFSPMLAGAVVMEYKVFSKHSMLGAVLWTTSVTLLGFYLGRAFPNAHGFLTPIIIGIIFVSLIPVIWEAVSKKFIKK